MSSFKEKRLKKIEKSLKIDKTKPYEDKERQWRNKILDQLTFDEQRKLANLLLENNAKTLREVMHLVPEPLIRRLGELTKLNYRTPIIFYLTYN